MSIGRGRSAVIILMVVYFFESPMFPTIFAMGTANLGRHARRGAGILIMGVSGGAVFPPIQGVIADAHSTRISFLVPSFCFLAVSVYALFHWIKHGCKVRYARSNVDKNIEVRPQLSHVSQPADSVNQTHARESTNRMFITTEYF